MPGKSQDIRGVQPGHSDRTVLLAQHILDVSAVAAQVHLSVEKEGPSGVDTRYPGRAERLLVGIG